jgi:CRISPR system Cascade subunit CasE
MGESVYLSLLKPNPLNWQAREDLADCVSMHRTLMRAFPDGIAPEAARSAIGLLYRIEYERSGVPRILVQSQIRPDWRRLPAGWHAAGLVPQVKDIGPLLDCIEVGMALRFRLLANPTRKICTKSGVDGTRSNGKRVELRGDDQWLAWLARKGEQHGFRVGEVQATELPDVVAQKIGRVVGRKEGTTGTRKLTFFGVLFEGALEVCDRARFLAAVRAGVGPGKAFGFGLLSVARLPRW